MRVKNVQWIECFPLAPVLVLLRLPYLPVLKMETVGNSETMVPIFETTWHDTTEVGNLPNYSRVSHNISIIDRCRKHFQNQKLNLKKNGGASSCCMRLHVKDWRDCSHTCRQKMEPLQEAFYSHNFLSLIIKPRVISLKKPKPSLETHILLPFTQILRLFV
jgi:hypothetical protein